MFKLYCVHVFMSRRLNVNVSVVPQHSFTHSPPHGERCIATKDHVNIFLNFPPHLTFRWQQVCRGGCRSCRVRLTPVVALHLHLLSALICPSVSYRVRPSAVAFTRAALNAFTRLFFLALDVRGGIWSGVESRRGSLSRRSSYCRLASDLTGGQAVPAEA